MSENLSFKTFLKEEESYFTAMLDDLGIHPDDQKMDPKIGSFFSFGKSMVNIAPYQIMDYKKNEDGKITHVVVKKINDPHIINKKYINDKKVEKIEDEKYVISVDDLQKLLIQGQDQPQQEPMM